MENMFDMVYIFLMLLYTRYQTEKRKYGIDYNKKELFHSR